MLTHAGNMNLTFANYWDWVDKRVENVHLAKWINIQSCATPNPILKYSWARPGYQSKHKFTLLCEHLDIKGAFSTPLVK